MINKKHETSDFLAKLIMSLLQRYELSHFYQLGTALYDCSNLPAPLLLTLNHQSR